MLTPVLVVGAGAAGLMAARRLAAEGFAVTLVEAAAVAGGRMYSFSIPGIAGFVEAGAEFVHGDLPITLQLAKEAEVPLIPTHHSQVTMGGERAYGSARWDELMEKMGALVEDQPFETFLDTRFSGEEYARLRQSARGFAQGFDLADLSTVSTKALYAEWSAEEDSSEYRVEGGYGRLVDYLVRECRRLGAVLHFASPVTHIQWKEGKVTVVTAGEQRFTAERVVVTVSLAMLPKIAVTPAIPDYLQAAAGIGYGSVIKILLEFLTPFWRKERPGAGTLFILSGEPVPTWWTQADESSTLLTGWLTGENMRRFRELDAAGQISSCLASLAAMFSLDPGWLRDQLAACRIFDWEAQPYVHGGYSFDTVETPQYRRLLQTPVAKTIYFAGEAIYAGTAPGTVEAAFHSGLDAAEMIIARHKPRY